MSESRRPFESLSWEVKACSKVVIHQNFLSAIFNSGNKLKLLLKFTDVTNLVIHEAAFTITGTAYIEMNNNKSEKKMILTNKGMVWILWLIYDTLVN